MFVREDFCVHRLCRLPLDAGTQKGKVLRGALHVDLKGMTTDEEGGNVCEFMEEENPVADKMRG